MIDIEDALPRKIKKKANAEKEVVPKKEKNNVIKRIWL